MATLAKDTPQVYADDGNESDTRLKAEAAIYVGATLVEGAAAYGCTNRTTGTSGFHGLALDGATASGDMIRVRQKGNIVTAIAATVAAGDEGTTVYCPASTTNPADWNKSSTNGLPVGKIKTVLTAGASGANKVEIAFEADVLRSL